MLDSFNNQHVVSQGPAWLLFAAAFIKGTHRLLNKYVTRLLSLVVLAVVLMIISARLMVPCTRLYSFKQNFETKQRLQIDLITQKFIKRLETKITLSYWLTTVTENTFHRGGEGGGGVCISQIHIILAVEKLVTGGNQYDRIPC